MNNSKFLFYCFLIILQVLHIIAVPKLVELFPENNIDSSNSLIETSKSEAWMNNLTFLSKDVQGLVDVFQGELDSWSSVFQKNRWPIKPERYMTACSGEGQYLNLCGECVGGKTEKDDNFGLDECGICHGLQRCNFNGCKEPSLDVLDDDEEGNCTQIMGVKPNVIDLADGSARAMVYIVAADLKPDSVSCFATFEGKNLGPIEVKAFKDGLVLEFDSAPGEGKLEFLCNTTEGITFRHELLAVNSSKLKPTSSSSNYVLSGEESKLMLRVSNMYALADLVCFGKQNNEIVYKYWTNDIQGNSLSSEVFCERIWPKESAPLEIGVAYSETSLGSAQTIQVAVHSPNPKIINSVMNKDKIVIIFDRNIEQMEGCSAVGENILIGKDASCEAVANEFRIILGEGASLKKGQEFKIGFPKMNVHSTILQNLKEMENIAKIEGPSMVCPGETVEYTVTGRDIDGNGANWTLGVIKVAFSESISPGNRQRMNLLLWRNARESQRHWNESQNQISLNTSLLLQGVEYELKAVSKKIDGEELEVSKNLKIAKAKSPIVYIKGVKSVDINSDVMFEAKVFCGNPDKFQYEWEIGAEEPNKLQSGSKLILKAGSFDNNFNSVAVKLLDNNQVVSQDKISVLMQYSEAHPPTYIDEMIFGTGKEIEIPMNKHNIEYTYSWRCSTDLGKCMTPGKDSKEIEAVGTIDVNFLRIAKGMLAVGRYEFEIMAKSPSGGISKKIVRIRVVPGEPPILNLISLDAGPTVKIGIRASDVITTCELTSETLKATNYSYIDLKELGKIERLEGTPISPVSRDLLLTIQETSLKFGTKYKFRFSVDCGPLAQSYLVLSIPLRSLTNAGRLEVFPTSGEAMKTPFKMKLKTKLYEDSIIDFGFSYNDTLYFVKKDLQPTTVLYSFPGTVKTFAKICQIGKLCKIIYGPDISVQSSSTIPDEVARNVLKSYKDALNSCMYDVAIGNVKILAESTKQNDELYKNITEKVGTSLDQQMEKINKIINVDDSVVNDALKLLQSSMKIVEMMDNPEESMVKVLKFRDKIQAAFKNKAGKLEQSANLKPEPRPKRDTTKKLTKRQVSETSTSSTIKGFLTASTYLIKTGKNQSVVTAEKASLIRHIPDYLSDLCNALSSTSLHATSEIAELSAAKYLKTQNRQEIRLPECDGVCSNFTGQMILPKNFFEKYDKSNKSDSVCIAGAYLPYDYLTDISNYSSENNIARVSGLYLTRVFKYDGNIVIKEKVNSTGRLGLLRLKLWDGVSLEGNDIKCHTWISDEKIGWNENACKTMRSITLNGQQAYECKCPLQGIHALFKMNVTTTVINVTTTTTEAPSSTTETISNKDIYKYTASFVIDENFKETVGDRKIEFEQKIKEQLIEQVKLPNETNLQTDNKEETIKVTLKLMHEDSRTPSVVLDMAKILSKGDLKLNGLDNKNLKVPGQNLEVYLSDKNTSSSSTFIATISFGVFVLVLCVVAILLSGLFMKWRREHRAMNFIQSMENNSRPKYLKLHESSSLETIEQTVGGSPHRAGELDSGIVLTVDPNKIASKYQPLDKLSFSS